MKTQMRALRLMVALAAMFTFGTTTSYATPVSQEQAKQAVRTYLSRDSAPMGAKVGKNRLVVK